MEVVELCASIASATKVQSSTGSGSLPAARPQAAQTHAFRRETSKQFSEEILPAGDFLCFGATHKKPLDLISEGRKIGFVALHNMLFGFKRNASSTYQRPY
jgi:hypothetical protein